jgi:hypothetical protein
LPDGFAETERREYGDTEIVFGALARSSKLKSLYELRCTGRARTSVDHPERRRGTTCPGEPASASPEQPLDVGKLQLHVGRAPVVALA